MIGMRIISLRIREFRENLSWEGRTYLTSVYEIPYISECTVKPYDILSVTKAFSVKSVNSVTQYVICHLVMHNSDFILHRAPRCVKLNFYERSELLITAE